MNFRVLITGSRDWDDLGMITKELSALAVEWYNAFNKDRPPLLDIQPKTPGPFIVVHGDCPTGADKIAKEWAETHNFPISHLPLPAEWTRHDAGCPDWHRGLAKCNRAGFRRNAEMVKLGADVCYAFIKNGSKGATMTADLAEKAGIPVKRFIA